MSKIRQYFEEEGKNSNDRVAFNTIIIILRERNGDYIDIEDARYELIRKHINRDAFIDEGLMGIHYRFSTGLIFESTEELEREAKKFSQSLKEAINIVADVEVLWNNIELEWGGGYE